MVHSYVWNNAFADSSTSKIGSVHGGLSKLGKSAIIEMNTLGESAFVRKYCQA